MRRRALAGTKEAGYLVDESSGEVLDYREARDETPYEIDFPEAEACGRALVCYLHSHNVLSPPGEADWNNMIELPTMNRYVAVCGDRIFVLERTSQTRNPFSSPPGMIFDYEMGKRLKQSTLGHLPIKKAMLQLPEAEMQEVLRDVNLRLASIYRVVFREEWLT